MRNCMHSGNSQVVLVSLLIGTSISSQSNVNGIILDTVVDTALNVQLKAKLKITFTFAPGT